MSSAAAINFNANATLSAGGKCAAAFTICSTITTFLSTNCYTTRFEELATSDTTARPLLQNVSKSMKLIIPSVLFVASALLLTGCANTWNNSNKIELGMTKPQLLAAIGQPEDSLSPGDNVEILRYIFQKPRTVRLPPAVPLKKVYLVRLEDGRVVAYGTERDFVKTGPRTAPPKVVVVEAPKNEKTININVRTEGSTNPVAPIQPKLELKED